MNILQYWPVVFAFLCGVAVCIIFAIQFAKEPSEKKMEMVREWLLFAVIQAEKELGGGTGQLKLRYVWDMFIKTFPAIASVISFEMFSALVDDALEQMRKILESNKALANYVEGE